MDFSRFKPNLPSSNLKDNPPGRKIMLSQLSQVVLILKGVLETTGMWTVLFLCQINFIFFQITKLLTMEVGQWKEFDAIIIFYKQKEWETF
jgi:hypothetical protein